MCKSLIFLSLYVVFAKAELSAVITTFPPMRPITLFIIVNNIIQIAEQETFGLIFKVKINVMQKVLATDRLQQFLASSRVGRKSELTVEL